MTVDELIAKLEEGKAAGWTGDTEVGIYDDEYGAWDTPLVEIETVYRDKKTNSLIQPSWSKRKSSTLYKCLIVRL